MVPVSDTSNTSGISEEPIPVACPNCSASIRLVPKLLGRRVFCNTCRSPLQVSLTLKRIEAPHPQEPIRGRQEVSHEVLARAVCVCGMHFKTLEEFSAEEMKCPRCGRIVRFASSEVLPVASSWSSPQESRDVTKEESKLGQDPVFGGPQGTGIPRHSDSFRRVGDLEATARVGEADAGTPAREFCESRDELVFGLPEVAEDPFPGGSANLNSPETNESNHVGRHAQPIVSLEYGVAEIAEGRRTASVLPPSLPQTDVRIEAEADYETTEQEEADSQDSDEIDLTLPETSLPRSEEARREATTDSVPLTPHEVTLALRDQEVGAALRRIQGGYVPEVEEPSAGELAGAARSYSVAAGRAPWTWPLVAAIGATCMMLTSLYYILYVM